MKKAGHPDHFVVINGPEDGAEFPITRTPVYLGNDPQCAINLRLDNAIKPYHARVTVVSDGYRIRSIGGAPIFVDGKRVGTLFSRIIRDGEFVQVGNTFLALECAPDGLAVRSRGMPSESDIAWLMRQTADGAFRASRWSARFLINASREATHHWKFFLLLGFVIVYLVYAPFRITVNATVSTAWDYVQSLMP
ncbi:MAG: FHA domain-containing protein [Candidatus Hydrogenedentota bacterium]